MIPKPLLLGYVSTYLGHMIPNHSHLTQWPRQAVTHATRAYLEYNVLLLFLRELGALSVDAGISV